MTTRDQTEQLLRDWQGSDATERQTPAQIAEAIDRLYKRPVHVSYGYTRTIDTMDVAGVPAHFLPAMPE